MAQSPEIALWRAVIQQAITDANMVIEDLPPWPKLPEGSHGKTSKEVTRLRSLLSHKYKRNRDERNARDEAREWLRDAGVDFRWVCDAAAMEPAWVALKVGGLFPNTSEAT